MDYSTRTIPRGKMIRRQIDLPIELDASIREVLGDVPMSAWIRRAIEQRLDRDATNEQ